MQIIREHLYIFLTIFFTVYGQLVIKWQMHSAGPLPDAFMEKLKFLLKMFFNAWVISSFSAAFLAALCWMAAMTKFELSYAYPFMSLSFVLVLILSNPLFHEPITTFKVLGVALIMVGIIVGTR